MPHGRRIALVASLAALGVPAAPARAADPVVAAAGDIACGPAETGVFPCQQMATSDLLLFIHPDAVLALGDNQYNSGSLPDYNTFYNPSWGRLKSITHPAIGNHEYGNSLAGYFDYYGAAAGPNPGGYYSFDVGAWHLIALNSNCDRVPGGCGAGSPQEAWLRSDLKAHPAACTLAFQHHPLWATTTFQQPLARPLFQALYDADAEVLLTGHDHLYDRFAPSAPNQSIDNNRGVQQFIVGTGGRDFSGLGAQNPNSQLRQNTTFGVLKLTLHPTSYDWQFMPVAGQGFADSGARACHGPGAPPPAATPPGAPPQVTPSPPTLANPAPAISPPEDEDAESSAARVATRLSVSSVSVGRRRVVVRGRMTTGASAGKLRITLSRKIRGRRVIISVRRVQGGRSGSWRGAAGLPRRARGVHTFRLTVRYVGERSYSPALLRGTTRVRPGSFLTNG